MTLMPLLGLPAGPIFVWLAALLALVSFILAIVCMAEKKIAHGLINLLAIVIGLPLLLVVGLLWW